MANKKKNLWEFIPFEYVKCDVSKIIFCQKTSIENKNKKCCMS